MVDPVAVASSVKKAITTILENVEHLEKRVKHEKHLMESYKRTLRGVDAEVMHVQTMTTTIVGDGSRSAVDSLLAGEQGQEAYEQLLEDISSTNDLLTAHKEKTTDLLRKIDTLDPTRGVVILAALGYDVDKKGREELEELIKEGITEIEEARDGLTKQFQHFHELYRLYRAGDSSATLRQQHKESRRRDDALDRINHMFDHSPFKLHNGPYEDSDVDGICYFNEKRESAERASTLADELGTRWVDSLIGTNPSVAEICKAQIALLRSLPLQEASSLERSLNILPTNAPYVAQKAQANATENSNALLKEMQDLVDSSLKRETNQVFSIAFCGTVKAGKSSFLNSLIGRKILPSDELPATAWPCRVRHASGIKEPVLEVNPKIFQKPLKELQRLQYGLKLKDYSPEVSEDDPFSGILDDDTSFLSSTEESYPTTDTRSEKELHSIYNICSDLQPKSRENLLKFEKKDFVLRDRVEGLRAVHELLAELNDIVRLCLRFQIPFGILESQDWPLLTIEFLSLQGRDFEGIFEFIDLPGIAEHFEDFKFEDLIRRVSKDFTLVVPVISFKELSLADWRFLPSIINNGTGRPPPFVLCTHFDLISRDRLTEQLAQVKRVFWSGGQDPNCRILTCSSKMGLSAQTLLRMSENGKPAFKDIWDRTSIQYHCAEKILGVGNPESHYNKFTSEEWVDVIQDQLDDSGLHPAIEHITKDTVAKAQQRLLMSDNKQIWRHVRKVCAELKRQLLEMRRSHEDYESAYKEFSVARKTYMRILENWDANEARRKGSWTTKLQRSFKVLEKERDLLSPKSVNTVAKSLDPKMLGVDARGQSDPNNLVFANKLQAEAFLKDVHEDLTLALSKLRRQFVVLVRDLTNRACDDRMKALKIKIEEATQEGVNEKLKTQILEDLSEGDANITPFSISHIDSAAVHKLKERYNGPAAFHDIRSFIAKDFDSLGFMVKGPVTAIAAFSWAISAGVWPFMYRLKAFEIKKAEITRTFDAEVVNTFLKSLKQEGEKTLEGVLRVSAEGAKAAVEDVLMKEETRYQIERSKKEQPADKRIVAETLACFINFQAADSAMFKLQEHLIKVM
ncbi:hypothetical protein SCHPADRAFT_938629 [Schizopora paradoxa]|uniref:Dynamin N-terminal domain-containing protein n=1 Tax=Schizopora paradoxa TaxID=27342 RepID=A0A0H2RUJ1_9AGAM|nr:hypothetical protein SCHPADRAFT_938629 [Schizopora paradoxa]